MSSSNSASTTTLEALEAVLDAAVRLAAGGGGGGGSDGDSRKAKISRSASSCSSTKAQRTSLDALRSLWIYGDDG